MKTQDIDNATAQHVICRVREDRTEVLSWSGSFANKLINSRDFKAPPFVFSVWEVLTNVYFLSAFRLGIGECDEHLCILRANQTTLEGALKYMDSENRVLVHNVDEQERLDDL